MASRSLLPKWIGEFCSPVVVTVATAEVESICLKNGLLLHELLSAFSKLDGVNATVRSSNYQVEINDAHIRFERVTEVRGKSPSCIEEQLRATFEECDASMTPTNLNELKSTPTTAWGPRAEQIVLRSMAFSEFEMLSHPVILLTVVATTDVDPVACMQELASVHHTPSCLSSGQYDADSVQRVYLLIHDTYSAADIDPRKEFAKMQSNFPPQHTKYLALNSQPPEMPNLQQPDIWSVNTVPLYFPQLAPTADNASAIPKNPINGQPVLGCRLIMEDFVALREFCMSLYHQEILPCIERRIGNLSKIVADTRKGVKNVLKSFWRKPREDSPTRGSSGGPRYRCDRIEAQILLLADTCFGIKDYDTAMSMYKLVKEDFKADKSTLHLAYATVMIALCHMIMEPGKPRETAAQLEGIQQLIGNYDPIHAGAYFALLCSEIYLQGGTQTQAQAHHRLAIDAAHLLLQAASSAPKLSLLCSMLTERAAASFLIAGQSRKFAFYESLSGYKYQSCGERPARHAVVCFLNALLVYEKSRWGYIKGTLTRSLALELKHRGRTRALAAAGADSDRENQHIARAVLMTLKSLAAVLLDENNVCGAAMEDTEAVLADLLRGVPAQVTESPWGSLTVHEGWAQCATNAVLLRDLPPSLITLHPPATVDLLDMEGMDDAAAPPTDQLPEGHTEVYGLPVPEVDLSSLELLQSLNGASGDVSLVLDARRLREVAEDLGALLDVEKSWVERRALKKGEEDGYEGLADAWAQLLADMHPAYGATAASLTHSFALHPPQVTSVAGSSKPVRSNRPGQWSGSAFRVACGESVIVKARLRNRLSTALKLTDLRLEIRPAKPASATEDVAAFTASPLDVTMLPGSTADVILRAVPATQGSFRVSHARWTLSHALSVRQSLTRPGPLLQKSVKQRTQKMRGDDTSLCFEVLPSQPSLHVRLEGGDIAAAIHWDMSDRHSNHGHGQGQGQAAGAVLNVLHGQILRTNLVIRNEGSARAELVVLKVSHPGLVLAPATATASEAACLLDTFGPSATVFQLPGGPIAPGAEVQFATWVRLTDLGPQRLSVLASYRGAGAGTGKEGSGAERSSVYSLQALVMPSLRLSGRSFGGLRSAVQRVLAVEVVNCVEAAPSSRSGSPRSPGGGAGAGSDEGRFKVEGMWVMGGAARCGTSSSAKTSSLTPTERLNLAVPVTVDVRSASCSWVQALAPSLAAGVDTAPPLVSVIERILCQSAAHARLTKAVLSARLLVQQEAAHDGEQGPRTISQVRKDRQKMAASSEQLNMMDVDLLGADGGMDVDMSSGVKPPRCAADMASLEAAAGSASVTLVWTCSWQGQTVLGMHSCPGLTLLPEITAPSAAGVRAAVDCLSVELAHAPLVTLPAPLRVFVPVTVELRNTSDRAVVAAVEVVDRKSRTALVSEGDASAVASSGAAVSAMFPSQRGLRWENKTSMVDINVPPFGTAALAFTATMARCGMYDMNRFKITAQYGGRTGAEATGPGPGTEINVKFMSGNSLIEVVAAES